MTNSIASTTVNRGTELHTLKKTMRTLAIDQKALKVTAEEPLDVPKEETTLARKVANIQEKISTAYPTFLDTLHALETPDEKEFATEDKFRIYCQTKKLETTNENYLLFLNNNTDLTSSDKTHLINLHEARVKDIATRNEYLDLLEEGRELQSLLNQASN